ncbi:PolB1-binding protein PBP2 family protein [Staphylothermus hellenicus]|uniref:Uncharacterized protein n=1 Tax=Staphylothermus hellenicus (strain DSM 12710 / JCM 10830 / BK20S6-10-b1 / P8) TaxID=591019 RepID=D7DBL7_STAHD|nr:hypothetical protein [Staphylothermus hellenicus]ADI31564.1 hypothetical protein Shell_0433 [Staphylothermus hellenicus DSM 12710]
MEEKKPSLKDILKLPKLERLVMDYFLKHISVGEIIAIIELREEVKRLRDPDLVPEFDDVIIELEIGRAINKLLRNNFLEYRSGCYNLAPHLREELKKKLGELRPGFPKHLEELIS